MHKIQALKFNRIDLESPASPIIAKKAKLNN